MYMFLGLNLVYVPNIYSIQHCTKHQEYKFVNCYISVSLTKLQVMPRNKLYLVYSQCLAQCQVEERINKYFVCEGVNEGKHDCTKQLNKRHCIINFSITSLASLKCYSQQSYNEKFSELWPQEYSFNNSEIELIKFYFKNFSKFETHYSCHILHYYYPYKIAFNDCKLI